MSRTVLFFHSNTSIGGTENNIAKISKELKHHNFKIYFCALNKTEDFHENISSYVDGCLVLCDYIKNPIKSYSRYKSYLEITKPDVVLNFGLRVELFSRLFSKRFGIDRIISNIRSTDDWRKWYHSLLDKLTQSTVDLWIANSEAGKLAFIKREKLSEEKVMVIYNFIESISFPVINTYKTDNILKIGVLANIRPAKGHDLLVDLAKVLIENKLAFKFILAGKDFSDGSLWESINEEGLKEYFDYRGFISCKEPFFNEIQLSLLPSKWEGLPTSILEAMAVGVPVIATNVGGIPEIIDNGIDGILVEYGCLEQMSNEILKLQSKELRVEIAKNAKNKIKRKFSKNAIMDQWISAIEN